MDIPYQEINSKTIDRWVEEGWEWGKPVSHEEYEKAKKRRKSTKRVIQTRERHLLDDMIFCEDCGKKMYLNLA